IVRGPEWRLPLSTHGHWRRGAQSAHRAEGGESSVQHRRWRPRHGSFVASYRRSTRCFRPGESVGRGSGKASQRAWLLSPSCALWATGRKTDRVGPVSGQDAPAQREADRAEQAGVSQEIGKVSAFSGQLSASAFNDALSRSEEHTSELQSLRHLVWRLLLEKKKHKHMRSFVTCCLTLRHLLSWRQ